MKKILLKNATIYTGYEKQVLKHKDILIINQKITKIGSNLNSKTVQIIDCSNKFITPGLINLHAHLFGDGKPSKNLGSSKTQKIAVLFSKTHVGKNYLKSLVKRNAKMELMGGVTTIRTSGDLNYSDVWLRDLHLKDVPRLIVPGPAITNNIGHGHGTFAITSDNPEVLRELVRKNVKHKVDYIKTTTTGGVMDATKKGEPGVVKVTKEQLKAIVDEAHKHGLKVASHTESEAGINLDVECGVDFIEHGSTFSDKVANIMKKKGMKFTITITPAIAFAELPTEVTKCGSLAQYNSRVVTNSMIKCAKKALKNGIDIALGTDSACPFALQHMVYKEMVFAKKMIGITAGKALELMTINNARLLGLDHELGSVEEGKVADLLVLSKDPIKNLNNFANLDYIIHLGNIFKQKKYPKYKEYENIINNFKGQSEYSLK